MEESPVSETISFEKGQKYQKWEKDERQKTGRHVIVGDFSPTSVPSLLPESELHNIMNLFN